ncbi:hypothetical protein LWI29_030396 [Acer saccharum]|uniref:Integrase catalytic domain-containing protein n=1 Tax=Acer saccharum TaxID=4024 RepID=A0AA39SHQ1_ACESA|nr:hypothetical protein LWI29_030396 [Acer saccharum]
MGFDEEFLAVFMLTELLESWKMICQSIANLFGKEKLDHSQVVNMIMTEEIRMREEGFGASTSSALNMEGRESRNRNQNTNQQGISKSRGKSKSRYQVNYSENQQRNKKDVECWNCGAVFHATPHRELFENYVSENLGKVYLGDDQACNITGKGDVKIQLKGSVWKLNNVRHIPHLRKNLISIGQLVLEGYVTTFIDDKWKILKGKLPDLKSVEVDFCESCVLGKQKRVSFKKTGKGEAGTSAFDVWGPASVSSTGGKQYFITFIDDHSRKVWVYFLKHKFEVFDAFKRWKARVENETGLKIKKLHSDNGGEYKDSDHARNKLDAKSVKCTLVGYGEDEFGYKLWDDQNCKMIRSRDVVFNERVMYKDRNTQVSEPEELEYFGSDDVSDNKIVEPVNQNDEEQGVPL